MQHNSDPPPSIAQAQASGAVAECFAALRRAQRLPQVNLLWRCLAVDEAALRWAWEVLAPLHEGGRIWGAAAGLGQGLPAPEGAPAVDAAALGPAALTAIDRLLAAYERGNSLNMLGMGALLVLIEEGRPAAVPPPAAPAPAPLAFTPPPLLEVAALPAPVAALVAACNRLGSVEEAPMFASVYRQLAHWPAFLAEVSRRLAPLHERGELQAARSRVLQAAGAGSRALAAAAAVPARPAPPLVADLARYFTTGALPRMLVLVPLMRGLLPAPPAGAQAGAGG